MEREKLEKLKSQGVKGLPEEVDESKVIWAFLMINQKVIPRLKDEFLIRCFKWRLSQNDCLNRGYVLDGFPRSYKNARHLFMG